MPGLKSVSRGKSKRDPGRVHDPSGAVPLHKVPPKPYFRRTIFGESERAFMAQCHQFANRLTPRCDWEQGSTGCGPPLNAVAIR